MIQWLPPAITAGASVVSNVIAKSITAVGTLAQATNVIYTQNYRQKELTTRMVQMYTTDSSNIKGSLLPEEKHLLNKEKSEQIEELIHSLLNQTRANNI